MERLQPKNHPYKETEDTPFLGGFGVESRPVEGKWQGPEGQKGLGLRVYVVMALGFRVLGGTLEHPKPHREINNYP